MLFRSLWDYFLACPLMCDRKRNVDFLPEQSLEYFLYTTPATEIIKQYVDGSSVRQYLFVIRSVQDYGSDVLQNIANSGFFESLSNWLEEQTRKKNFPTLPSGKEPQKIEAQSTGYLFVSGPDTGKYQIQCRLQYFQEV